MPNVLILGGTTEASALAAALAARAIPATLSYAGRTAHPLAQPVPVRIGGFGGVEGLAAYLRTERVTHVVDATHPFAARISAHAIAAAGEAGVPLLAFTRPAWVAGVGDCWTALPDFEAVVAALAGPPRRVMLAIGRQSVALFAAQPQHHYLLRFVDPPYAPPPLPRHHLLVDRGPFTAEGEQRLLTEQAINVLVCKNAGGRGGAAKLGAARQLALPVLMVDRPAIPARAEAVDLAAVLRWIDHAADRGV